MNDIDTTLGVRTPYSKAYADHIIHIMILGGLLACGVFSVLIPVFRPSMEYLAKHGWTSFIVRPCLLWFGMGLTLLLVRTLLWIRYRPYLAVSRTEAPHLTVVIPAYNEGALVKRSILSAAAASYPRDRLEIIVIDDGSRDDTWMHIEAAAREHPALIRTIRFPKNSGKRAALAAGFEHARGEVVVTLDSDSLIDANTLLAIAGPFRDPDVGAVAGKVSVLNRFESLLPRMIHVRYVLAFDFLRSAQSTYGAVYCCPGALSAYRLSLVRRILPAWLQQHFLGAPCAAGEDRALTNDILALGYKAVYQRTAVVHTLVPDRYGKLCRMFLRWDRSYIREETRLLTKVCWKLRPPALLMTLIEKSITNLRYPISYLAMGLMVAMSIEDPWMILRFLAAVGLTAFFYMLYYLKSERNWEFGYGILYAYFSAFTMFWIFPYALLTLRSRSWMTR
jgi:hyaluronan synthase